MRQVLLMIAMLLCISNILAKTDNTAILTSSLDDNDNNYDNNNNNEIEQTVKQQICINQNKGCLLNLKDKDFCCETLRCYGTGFIGKCIPRSQ